MDQLLDLLAGLEVSELASKEVHLSVLLALEEVTRHQRTLRGVLDRLERRQNREEVNLLLDMFDTDEEELQEEVGQEGQMLNYWNFTFLHLIIIYSESRPGVIMLAVPIEIPSTIYYFSGYLLR